MRLDFRSIELLHRTGDAVLHRVRYHVFMTRAARKLFEDVLALPEDERLELASEIIASLDGEPDEGWDAAWMAEADRRADAARQRGESGTEWTLVRDRVLKQLGK